MTARSITLADLVHLDDRWLEAGTFRPEEFGIPDEDVAAALHRHPQAAEHVLRHAPRSRTSAWQTPPPDADDRGVAAERALTDAYWWEIAMRKHPEVYEIFSQSQEFPFDRLFPAEVLADRDVLDAGCGSGRATEWVAAVARSVVACDPNPRVLEIAQRKFRDDRRVSVRAGSFGALPLEPESVDVVVSNLAYGWSEQRGGYGGLRELERVTRRGGQIRLVVGDQEATRRFLLDAGFDEHLVHETVRYAPIERADRAPVLHEFFARATIDGRLFAPLPLPVFVRVVA